MADKLLLRPARTLAISTAICNLCKGPGWAPEASGLSFPAAQEVRRMGFVQQLGWPGMWGTLRMGCCRLLCPPRYQSPLPCQSLPPVQKSHNPHGINIICYFNKAITKWFIYFLMHYLLPPLLLGFVSNFSLSGLKRFVFSGRCSKIAFCSCSIMWASYLPLSLFITFNGCSFLSSQQDG